MKNWLVHLVCHLNWCVNVKIVPQNWYLYIIHIFSFNCNILTGFKSREYLKQWRSVVRSMTSVLHVYNRGIVTWRGKLHKHIENTSGLRNTTLLSVSAANRCRPNLPTFLKRLNFLEMQILEETFLSCLHLTPFYFHNNKAAQMRTKSHWPIIVTAFTLLYCTFIAPELLL